MILHTKYQGSMLCEFRQDTFFHVFPIYAYVEHVNMCHLWPQGHNLNNLGRGL